MTEDFAVGETYTVYGRIGTPYYDLPWVMMDGAVKIS